MRGVVFGAVALAGAGAVAARKVLAGSRQGRDDAGRWLAVTVNCSPERLAEVPEPLARLGDAVEIRVTPAPGGKGTELAARLREPGPSGPIARARGKDPRQDVREALRDAKSLVETGEVIEPDTPPTARSTLLGKPLELASRRAGGEGRL